MSTEAVKPAVSPFERFNAVLQEAVSKKASDVHIVVGSGVRLRYKGEIVPSQDTAPLGPSDVAMMVAGILLAGRKCSRENVAQFVQSITDFDCSYSLGNI